MAWDALGLRETLTEELAERREAGYDVAPVEEPVRAALDGGAPEEMERALARLEELPLRPDWPFEEPSTLDEIRRMRPAAPEVPPLSLGDAEFRDRLHGAWLGRCAGCNLGKPVEGWTRSRIRRYLDVTEAHPIRDYLPALDDPPDDLQLNDCWPETTRGNVEFMARDDDIDYTILGLHVLEESGLDFSPEDVAAEWLDHLPFNQVYTAERVAYRNLVVGLRPPETGRHRNPYREWIGAQIRADAWGYVCPGDPDRASALAFKDASVSHTQNGIYGEMWVAALIAAAFVTDDVGRALEISLGCLPERSRLVDALRRVIDLHSSGVDWEQGRDDIEERYGHYSRVHTVNNAALVAAALLWGEGDYSRTIGLAVEGGWDTDCNGATAGSVFGAMHGTERLPSHWIRPLNDLVRSAILGFDGAALSDLADRTFRLATAVQGSAGVN
jgi:ADP-ribosylglycohydrolase